MTQESVNRRKLFQLVVAGALSPVIIGCGGIVGEIAVAVAVIKLIAGATAAILIVQGLSWQVQSAKLDAEAKRLKLQGIKDGKKVYSTIDLTDEQVQTIQDKGQLEVKFDDGASYLVKVTE